MAATRAATGNSKPRTFPKSEEVKKPVKTARKKTAGVAKKAATAAKSAKAKATKGTTASKANTSKPRAKKEASAKVTKPAAKKKATPVKKTATPKPKKAAATPKTETKAEPEMAEPHHEPTLGGIAKGIFLKAQGVITGSTGKKAAGTAKIRGTDGKKPAPKKAAKA